MTLKLFDSHCHLTDRVFDADRERVLVQAEQAGVASWMVPSVVPEDWPVVIKLCDSFNAVMGALGVHPWAVGSVSIRQLDGLADLALANRPCIRAIGETGLDRLKQDWVLQETFFDRQLDIARQCELPVIVHSVRAHADVLRHLKCYPEVRGVIHAFSGSLQEAEAYIERGFKLGVGGLITYERASKTRNAIAQLPLDSLVIETDAPAMPVSGHQGRRNEPAQLFAVYQALCAIRSESASVVARTLADTSAKLFSIRH